MPKLTIKSEKLDIEIPAGGNFREAMQEAGTLIPFGCEQGVCGTCLVNVESGAENIDAKTDQEEQTLGAFGAEPQQRLACQCNMKGPGPVVVDPVR